MTKQFVEIFRRGKTHILIASCVLAVTIALGGCEEKKKVELGGIPCEVVGKVPGDVLNPIEVNYGGKVKLLGATAEKVSQTQIKMSYYWQLVGDLGIFDSVFVHFVEVDKQILFQGDHAFCQKGSSAELKDKVIKETQLIDVPQSALGKEVEAKIGIYALGTPRYDRLKIESAKGVKKENGETVTVAKLHL